MSDVQWNRVRLALERLLATLIVCFAAGAASAAPVSYTFTTTGAPFGNLPPMFGSTAVVSGTFSYDPAVPPGATNAFGATVYGGSFSGLTGSVEGSGFSDPGGFTLVGNDINPPGVAGPADYLQLTADSLVPGGIRNLAGFTRSGWELVNVRLFWIETQLGIPDFLGDASLPGVLPSFAGRLGLDFAPAGTTTPMMFAFFDGLTVRPASVPEPGVLLLLGIGAAGLALHRRRGVRARV